MLKRTINRKGQALEEDSFLDATGCAVLQAVRYSRLSVAAGSPLLQAVRCYRQSCSKHTSDELAPTRSVFRNDHEKPLVQFNQAFSALGGPSHLLTLNALIIVKSGPSLLLFIIEFTRMAIQ